MQIIMKILNSKLHFSFLFHNILKVGWGMNVNKIVYDKFLSLQKTIVLIF